MKKRTATVGVVAVVAAAAWLVWGLDTADLPPPPSANEEALAATLGFAEPACALCHYAWNAPLAFVGKTLASGGAVVTATPTGSFDVVDVRAVPVVRGDESTSRVTLTSTVQVALGSSAAVAVDVDAGVPVLFASAVPVDDRARPTLRVTVVAPDGTQVAGEPGALAVARAVAPGGLPAGTHIVQVNYDAGTAPVLDVVVTWDAAAPGVTPLADMTGGVPATWDLPSGVSGDARSWVVTYRPLNVHPTDKWILPNFSDLGLYATVFTPTSTNGTRTATWHDDAVAAGWPADGRLTLVDETVDGTQVRYRNDRGEWQSRSSWRTPPGPEAPFAAIPPGTTALEASITWAPATPVSPVPEFYFSVTMPGDPEFFYPDPTEAAEGANALSYRVPVRPDQWEGFDGTGMFQGFALMRVDDTGVVAFDGTRRLVVTAVR